MIRFATVLLSVAIAAAAHAATKVDCSAGQTISGAIAALKPAAGYQIIDVTGACTDNVYIAPNQAIAIQSIKGASLTPKNTSGAAIESDGHLYLYNFAINTGNFAGVFVNQGGYAQVDALTITGPGDGIQVSDHSGALIDNSSIKVTGFAALNIYAGGDVEVDGLAIKGQTGPSFTGGSDGILCPSGTVTLNASGAPITLSGSGSLGLQAEGCVIRTFISSGQSITIDGNGGGHQGGGGVAAYHGAQVELYGVAVTNNTGFGVNVVENSEVTISGATITGNSGVALGTAQNGVISIANYIGINTITEPSGDTNALFGCYQGGKIYVDQIAGTIQPPPTQQNQGCLTIGGP